MAQERSSTTGQRIRRKAEWLRLYLQRIHWLYQMVMLARSRRVPSLLVRRNSTKIVIEAFPRSSNSFAVRLFQQCNPEIGYHEISHHSHNYSNVYQAVRYGIPALVIVRNPIDAIASNMVAYGDQSEEMLQILVKKYVDFYKGVEASREHIVLASFDDVVEGRFKETTRRLNQRFGTAFNENFDEKEMAERARQVILERSPNRHQSSRVPIPNAARAALYDRIKPWVSASPHREPAVRVYERITSHDASGFVAQLHQGRA